MAYPLIVSFWLEVSLSVLGNVKSKVMHKGSVEGVVVHGELSTTTSPFLLFLECFHQQQQETHTFDDDCPPVLVGVVVHITLPSSLSISLFPLLLSGDVFLRRSPRSSEPA